MKHLLPAITLLLLLASCSNTSQPPAGKQDSPATNTATNNQTNDSAKTDPAANDMEEYCNVEQVDYCVPLPLSEFVSNDSASDMRAKHVFDNKKDKKYELSIQGLLRSDVSVPLETYFANTYETAEEEGKIIGQKAVQKTNSCFYAKGYWSNFPETKFIEVTWLRKDDVVVLYASFDAGDSARWNNRLQTWLAVDSQRH